MSKVIKVKSVLNSVKSNIPGYRAETVLVRQESDEADCSGCVFLSGVCVCPETRGECACEVSSKGGWREGNYIFQVRFVKE